MTNAAKSGILVALVTVALLATATPPFAARNAAATATTWAKTYGGLDNATGFAMQPTADGGYAVVGETRPAGGNWDIWVLKLDAAGVIEWQYLYGGASRERPYQIRQTSDGGYIIAAETFSFGPTGGPNAWILKLDGLGAVQWQKVYAVPANTGWHGLLSSIEPTSDGGYIAAGSWRTNAWVVKLDPAGAVSWQKSYGTASTTECASAIRQTADGGYIVAGTVVLYPPGEPGLPSLKLLKLTNTGAISWQKTYGAGSGGQLCGEYMANNPDILVTPDGGYFVNPVYFYGPEATDGWALKVDSAGDVLWRKQYGTAQGEWFVSAEMSSNQGFVLVGNLYEAGFYHPWAVRLDSAGNVQWQKTYGMTAGAAHGYAIYPTSDDGVVLLGRWSEGPFVMKLDGTGNPGVCIDPTIGADSNAVVTSSPVTPKKHNAKAFTPSIPATATTVTPVPATAVESQLCTS